MIALTPAERELVALGAALACNCVPCMAFHIPAAQKAGLSEAQIAEAVAIARKVRDVAAQAVLQTATRALPAQFADADTASQGCGCR